MFSLIVVGYTTNLFKLKKDGSYIPNEGQNLVSNGDIELLNIEPAIPPRRCRIWTSDNKSLNIHLRGVGIYELRALYA